MRSLLFNLITKCQLNPIYSASSLEIYLFILHFKWIAHYFVILGFYSVIYFVSPDKLKMNPGSLLSRMLIVRSMAQLFAYRTKGPGPVFRERGEPGFLIPQLLVVIQLWQEGNTFSLSSLPHLLCQCQRTSYPMQLAPEIHHSKSEVCSAPYGVWGCGWSPERKAVKINVGNKTKFGIIINTNPLLMRLGWNGPQWGIILTSAISSCSFFFFALVFG